MFSLSDEAVTIGSALDADHKLPAGGGEAVVLLAIAALWMAGVVLLIVLKFRAR